jgi:endonuclease/exonuclease/phosphatase family metal-dependent hydrolase
MQFSVLYWNVWLDNQIRGQAAAQGFLDELARVVKQCKPDVIGLNEVMRHVDAKTPFVLDFLQQLGYQHIHFTPASPVNDEWVWGSGIASKMPLKAIEEIDLSEEADARKHGYPGHTVKAIAAKVLLPYAKHFQMVVAHPLYIRPHTTRAHFDAISALQTLMKTKKFAARTILGGDFNESAYWPWSFYRAMRQGLNFKTGSILHPTWLYEAWRWNPIRANIDQLYWTKDQAIKLLQFEVIKSKASDHRPIFARFDIS